MGTIGNDKTYIALNNSTQKDSSYWAPYSGKPGVITLAIWLTVLNKSVRLRTAGYIESTVDNSHPFRKRLYFYDPEGRDWEFVDLSENIDERNVTTLAD